MLYCSLLCSCVAEDLSDCQRQKLHVTLSFEVETQGTPTRAGETHAVTLYAYGDNGQCQLAHDFQIENLNGTTTLEVDLEPGTYDFVAWVNHKNKHFKLPHYDRFPQARPTKDVSQLSLDIPISSIIDNHPLPRLLHGSVSGRQLQGGDEEVKIPLVQNTNYIYFTVEGLERTTDVYEFKVRDYNGAYTFENEFAPCEPFSYVKTAQFGGNRLESGEMTVLRLAKGRTPEFSLRDRNTGKTLYPASSSHETNLVKLIEDAYKSQGKTIDFDKQHVFDIKIKFNGGVNMDVTITINGWEITEGDTGLRP